MIPDEEKAIKVAPGGVSSVAVAGVVVKLRSLWTAANPMRFSRIQAEWQRGNEEARVAARKYLLETYGNPGAAVEAVFPGSKEATFSTAVFWWVEKQDAFFDRLSLRVKALIVEGTVNGEETYNKLGPMGERVLIAVADAVVAFNTADAAVGEA